MTAEIRYMNGNTGLLQVDPGSEAQFFEAFRGGRAFKDEFLIFGNGERVSVLRGASIEMVEAAGVPATIEAPEHIVLPLTGEGLGLPVEVIGQAAPLRFTLACGRTLLLDLPRRATEINAIEGRALLTHLLRLNVIPYRTASGLGILNPASVVSVEVSSVIEPPAGTLPGRYESSP